MSTASRNTVGYDFQDFFSARPALSDLDLWRSSGAGVHSNVFHEFSKSKKRTPPCSVLRTWRPTPDDVRSNGVVVQVNVTSKLRTILTVIHELKCPDVETNPPSRLSSMARAKVSKRLAIALPTVQHGTSYG